MRSEDIIVRRGGDKMKKKLRKVRSDVININYYMAYSNNECNSNMLGCALI